MVRTLSSRNFLTKSVRVTPAFFLIARIAYESFRQVPRAHFLILSRSRINYRVRAVSKSSSGESLARRDLMENQVVVIHWRRRCIENEDQ